MNNCSAPLLTLWYDDAGAHIPTLHVKLWLDGSSEWRIEDDIGVGTTLCFDRYRTRAVQIALDYKEPTTVNVNCHSRLFTLQTDLRTISLICEEQRHVIDLSAQQVEHLRMTLTEVSDMAKSITATKIATV